MESGFRIFGRNFQPSLRVGRNVKGKMYVRVVFFPTIKIYRYSPRMLSLEHADQKRMT